MNQLLLRKVAIYTTGAVVGGGIGVLIARWYAIKTLGIDEPVEENKQQLKLPGFDRGQLVSIGDIEIGEEALNGKAEKPPITDYTSISTKHIRNKAPLSEVAKNLGLTVEGEWKSASEAVKRTDIISLDEYSENVAHMPKVILMYYEKDKTLVDQNNVRVTESITRLLGENGVEKFGEKSGDPDVVYVINRENNTLYEVICIHKSYTEEVLGESSEGETRQQEPPITRRRRTRKVDKIDEKSEEDDEE